MTPAVPPLHTCTADVLKSIARRWMGTGAYKLRKEELLAVLPAVLADPARVDAVAASLSSHERAVLGWLKRNHGRASGETIDLALRMAEVPLPQEPIRLRDAAYDLFGPMAAAGLVRRHDRPAEHLGLERRDRADYEADPRLLERVDSLLSKTLPIETLPTTGVALSSPRHFSAITLDLIAMTEAIKTMGGLSRTQSGTLRVNDLRRLETALGWGANPAGLAGVREPMHFFLQLLSAAQLVEDHGTGLHVAADCARVLRAPPALLIERLLWAYLRLRHWAELDSGLSWDRWDEHLPAARTLLLEGLRSLPAQGQGCHTIDAFSRALFARVGLRWSLSYFYEFQPPYGLSVQAVKDARREWEREQEARWGQQEQRFFADALRGPLTAIGLVQSGDAGPEGQAFRLTDLGRALLFAPDLAAMPSAADTSAAAAARKPAWVVQSTFEIIAYLEHATATQLTFLERHAERRGNHEHVAHYRLTVEALYGALERGSDIDEVMTVLEMGAGAALPQNVRAQLAEWASRRERLSVLCAARLLEFPSGAARDAAWAAAGTGQMVGERFLLLAEGQALPPDAHLIDYQASPRRCLHVSEDGTLTLNPGAGDLLVNAQADRYAERQHERRWQITAASVKRAGASAQTCQHIVGWLSARALAPVPALLLLAIAAWAGAPPRCALGELALLHCPDPRIAEILSGSEALRPLLCGHLAPGILVVARGGLGEVREVLERYGIAATALEVLSPA